MKRSLAYMIRIAISSVLKSLNARRNKLRELDRTIAERDVQEKIADRIADRAIMKALGHDIDHR